MALPICRLPRCSNNKMTNKQTTSGRSKRPSRDTARIVSRIACCFSTALFLCGCSTQQPLAAIPPNEPPPASAVVAAPPAENLTPPAPTDKPMAPLAEENNIFFALRSAAIDDAGKEKLRQHAERLKSNRQQSVLLVGHGDDQGSRNYNLAITEERLMAVQKLLRSYGVSARQIRRHRSSGAKTRPPCASKACQQQMRRVELVP